MIYLDTETFSATPIRNGTFSYAENCEVMIVTWAVDDGPVQHFDVTTGADYPDELVRLLSWTDEPVCAHNSIFDRNVLKHSLGIGIPIERWRDTMVKSYLHGLPGSLDLLCDILGVGADKAKLKEGKKLIHLFCKPIPFKHNITAEYGSPPLRKAEIDRLRGEWPGRATRETHPVEWARFIDYAKADIEAMREIDRKLPSWNYNSFAADQQFEQQRDTLALQNRGASATPEAQERVANPSRAAAQTAGQRELALWHLDQKINDRGFAVDTVLAQACVEAVADRKLELKDEIHNATDGAVASATQRDPVLYHALEAYGVSLPDLQKGTLQRRLDDPDIPEGLKEILRIRLQASSTAASKYTSLLKAVSADGRLRGTKQFAGGFRTARWAGRTFQPDNLPRPTLPDAEIDAGIEALLAGCNDLVGINTMALTSSAVRKCIIAPPGKKLVIADLANIEGRVLAWLAGEAWKLQAFREYDAGAGPDLYKLAYAKSFAITPDEVSKLGRQIGKVMELLLQYQGGVGAFLTGAAAYNIDLDDMATKAKPSIPDDVWAEATSFFDWLTEKKASTHGLSREVFCVCDSLKRMWRRAHPQTVAFWHEVGASVRAAIERPGVTIPCRMLKIRRDGAWLRIVLPSGRAMCYPAPQVSEQGQISYMGMNQYTKKWERINSYEGKFCENITQAVARDVLAYAMPRVEDNGYAIVLHVHDELVCETSAEDRFNAEDLSALMTSGEPWAKGLPLAAAGFETARYRKD